MLANSVGKSPSQIQELIKNGGLFGFFAGHLVFYGFLTVLTFIPLLPAGIFCVAFGIIYGKHLDNKRKQEKLN